MSKRSLNLLLSDIKNCILNIKEYTKGYSFNDFVNDNKTFDAVVRNFTIIGEASNRIDNDIKVKFAFLNWDELRGLRNRIVHEYFGINNEILWEIIENELDELNENLDKILNQI